MKMTILYVSQSGNTAKAAEFIRDGVCSAGPVDVKMMNLIGEEPLDAEFLGEKWAAIIGTPTYVANMAWQLKKWFDTERKISLAGKLGAVFSTARFIHGGPDIAMLGLLQHMITRGMLIYSSGTGAARRLSIWVPFPLKARWSKAGNSARFLENGSRKKPWNCSGNRPWPCSGNAFSRRFRICEN
jgi:NAD(P)H dehydrogenase (quinone)